MDTRENAIYNYLPPYWIDVVGTPILELLEDPLLQNYIIKWMGGQPHFKGSAKCSSWIMCANHDAKTSKTSFFLALSNSEVSCFNLLRWNCVCSTPCTF